MTHDSFLLAWYNEHNLFNLYNRYNRAASPAPYRTESMEFIFMDSHTFRSTVVPRSSCRTRQKLIKSRDARPKSRQCRRVTLESDLFRRCLDVRERISRCGPLRPSSGTARIISANSVAAGYRRSVFPFSIAAVISYEQELNCLQISLWLLQQTDTVSEHRYYTGRSRTR